MPAMLEVTVGPRKCRFTGSDHLALQAAVDYVEKLGGGTVRVAEGVYRMGNSLFLRSGVSLSGAGAGTVLRKGSSAVTRLKDDTDWYSHTVRVKDPGIFSVGGGILLRGKSPHLGNDQCVKRTVTGIEGDTLRIDKDPRLNFWIDAEAEAATLFPVVTGDCVNDILIEGLTIDGNRAESGHLDGNYGGGLFIQDCDRITVRDVITRDNNGDGMSWQVCDDVTVERCQSLNNADLGLHPGSGSQRPVVRDCVIRGCNVGFFFCWGVKNGVVEGNIIEDSGSVGISIGHRDTDNVVRNNQVRRSGKHGVLFREHPVKERDPHRNLFEGNLIEDSGNKGECVAIEMLGKAKGVALVGNRIVDTRRRSKARSRIGLRIGAGIRGLKLTGSLFEGVDEDVVDLR
jgi:polygalacturonase